jgi:hypothetical protein
MPDGRGEWGTGVRNRVTNPANETLASPLRQVKIDKGSAATPFVLADESRDG